MTETNSVVTVTVSFSLRDIPQQEFRRVSESFPVARSGANPSSLLPYISVDLTDQKDYERVMEFMSGVGRHLGLPRVTVSTNTTNCWGEFQVPEDAIDLCRKLRVALQVLFSPPATRL